MAEGEEILDAGIGGGPTDGSGGLPSHPLIRQYVAHVITDQYAGCERLDPADLPIPKEIADQILIILNGNGCQPIFVAEGMDVDCMLPQEIIEVKSNIRFKGLLVVFKDSTIQLEEGGQIYYQAFNELCGKFPDVKIKIVGIELKPTGEQSPVPTLAGTEVAEDGATLVRIHVFDGELTVKIEGKRILEMFENWQRLIDSRTGEVLGSRQKNTIPQTADDEVDEGNVSSTTAPEFKAETGAPTGCNIPLGAPNTPGDLLMAGIGIFAFLQALNKLKQK